jgi:hypothetical protein
MKTNSTLLFLILMLSVSVGAQHPLIGTWQLVRVSGVNAEGDAFAMDTTTIRETKIITPTHYMLMAHDVSGDSLVFNRCYAGKVEVKDNRYIETPLMSSLQIVDHVQADFTWTREGEHFFQRGTITRPDGKKVQVELVFRKVQSKTAYPKHAALGTWNTLSSTVTTHDGKTLTEKLPEVRVMQVITPTHWMGISYRNNKFENAMLGTYTMKGDKIYPVTTHSLLQLDPPKHMELSIRSESDKLKIKGSVVNSAGKRSTWEDICERM